MSRHQLLRRAGLAAAATAAVGPVHAADAATVTCGQLVTASITVDNDLTNCPGKGLVVGADNITIDLNGHTLDGDEASEPRDFTSDGVDVRAHDGVTVRNGRIVEFADAVQLGSSLGAASRNFVIELEVVTGGVREDPGDHNVIAFNRLPGVALVSGGETEVAFNNGAIVDVRSAGNRVEHNELRQVVLWGDRAYVADNLLTGQISVGISVLGSGSTIQFNRVVGADFGIDVTGSRNVLRRNLVLGSRFYGILVWGLHSEELPGPIATGNVLLNNTASRGAGDGIVVEGRLCDGFACAEAPVGTLLRHNRTRYNAGGDGIRVNAPQTTLVRNVARHNGDLGIQAVAGVSDGGENRAAFNGNPAQCVGVACGP